MLGQVKKYNWLVSFFQKFYGREGGFYFFESEVLMLKYNKTYPYLLLKYNKTYPYLLSFLHPSVRVFTINTRHFIDEINNFSYSFMKKENYLKTVAVRVY